MTYVNMHVCVRERGATWQKLHVIARRGKWIHLQNESERDRERERESERARERERESARARERARESEKPEDREEEKKERCVRGMMMGGGIGWKMEA